MTTAGAPPPERSDLSNRIAANVQLWASFLRTLYGPARGAEIGGLGIDDLPELLTDETVLREQIVARPELLRRLLAPLLDVPDTQRLQSPELRELLFAAVRDEDDVPTTISSARDAVRRDLDPIPPGDLPRRLRKASRLLDPQDLLEIEPASIRRVNRAFAVAQRVRCKVPLGSMVGILDPKKWAELGTFFDSVGPVPGRFRDHCPKGSGWYGLYEERFSVGWGAVRLNSFHPFLKVDFTYDSTCVRTDYSLAYEEDGQLECDDGFIEAKSIPGRLGWCEYVAEKALKFRSPAMDLLAPTVMALFLDNFLSKIEDEASREAKGSTWPTK